MMKRVIHAMYLSAWALWALVIVSLLSGVGIDALAEYSHFRGNFRIIDIIVMVLVVLSAVMLGITQLVVRPGGSNNEQIGRWLMFYGISIISIRLILVIGIRELSFGPPISMVALALMAVGQATYCWSTWGRT